MRGWLEQEAAAGVQGFQSQPLISGRAGAQAVTFLWNRTTAAQQCSAFSGVAAGLIYIQTPELKNREPWSYSSMELLIQKLTKTSRLLVTRCSRELIQSCTHAWAGTLISLEVPPPGCLYGCVWAALPFVQSIFTTLLSDNHLCLLTQPYLAHGAASVISAL